MLKSDKVTCAYSVNCVKQQTFWTLFICMHCDWKNISCLFINSTDK